MRPESWTPLAWLTAAAVTIAAWLGYRGPDIAFALFGWTGLCA